MNILSNDTGVNRLDVKFLVEPNADGVVDVSPLDDRQLFRPKLVVDEGYWRDIGVSDETIKMVKRVGLVKNLIL